jgi:predicted transcriptional regulator
MTQASLSVTTPSNLTNRAIGQYAERVGERYGIYDENGRAEIDVLLQRLGGSCEVRMSQESLHVEDRGRFTIYVPEHTSMRRDRFTLAHELGHYFLHYLYPECEGTRSFSRGGRDRAETEANVFASSLLMPSDHFREAWSELAGDIREMARRFDVSPDAADVRSRVLRLE